MDSELDELVKKVVADLMVGIITGEMAVSQAVKIVDSFTSELKGRLPEDKWLALRTQLLGYVFSCEKARQGIEQDAETPIPKPPKRKKSSFIFREGPIVQISPQDAFDEAADALWARIKPHLPQHILDNPKLLNRTARNIGFLCGLGLEKAAFGFLKTLGRLRG